jgi:hypothetical protein
MKIIETKLEFESFLEKSKGYDWIIVPTYCNGERPVYTDSVSVVYVYVINLDKEVMIVFNHTEGLSLPEELLNQFPEDNKLFVYGKKKFKRCSILQIWFGIFKIVPKNGRFSYWQL